MPTEIEELRARVSALEDREEIPAAGPGIPPGPG